MPKKKRRVGRPSRLPGRTYNLRDIPKDDYAKFSAACRRAGKTIREELILLIQRSNAEREDAAR